MTPRQAYCRLNKYHSYLRLLRLARISITPAENFFPELEEKTLVADLDALVAKPFPAIRTILPLIYRRACQSGLRDRLDPGAQRFLRYNTMRLIAAEIGFQQCLIKHIELFEKENIPVILLKGAAFSGNLYPDNAPRLGADLDILVSEDEFETACKLLSRSMKPVLMDPRRVATYKTLFERVFVPKDGNGPTVEIHRGLTNPFIFAIDNQELWQTSRQHPAYNSELVRVLSPENALLHLAVHAFRDLDFSTHNLLDAHEIWCQWQPDQEKLMGQATNWGGRKVLFYLLANCQEIMETPISDRLLDSLRPTYFFNRINRIILQSPTRKNAASRSRRYRLIQLISQITFPDHMHRGMLFQLSYARTRVHDWIINLRSLRSASSSDIFSTAFKPSTEKETTAKRPRMNRK